MTNKPLNETYILQLDDFVWSAPFTAGKKPCARYNHSASFVKNDFNECSIFVQGIGIIAMRHTNSIELLLI